MVHLTLTGRVTVSRGDAVLNESSLAGRLGRLLLVRLALARHPMSRWDVIHDLWPDDQPVAVESVLNATCSRLRTALSSLGLDGKDMVQSSSGTLALRLPVGSRVDVMSAHRAIDLAEAALRRRDLAAGWSSAVVAHSIARRPLLPGCEAVWIDRERDRLQQVLERSLATLSDIWLKRGDPVQSVLMARELVRIAPYSESAHRRVVAALVANGDRTGAAAAIRAWESIAHAELGVTLDASWRAMIPTP